MDVLKQILGRLHPLLVHLPIGFIVLGLLMQGYDRKKKEFGKAIAIIFLWGGISAVFASITGYLQYTSEGYTFDSVKFHLWSGILTAIFSFVMYLRLSEFKRIDFLQKIPLLTFSLLFFVLISFTGHLGGTITHGEDYLVEPLPNAIKSALGFETFEEKTIALSEEDWQEAILYEDLIKPILNNKCMSCHNPKKSKGELQLHSEEAILKGGENGEILVLNTPEESELYSRLILSKEDEDHMPPKEKTQLSKEEIKLIETWIGKGNPFNTSIGELGLEKELFSSFFPQQHDEDFPDIEVMAASLDSIAHVEENGIHVDYISESTNYLSVSCINKPSFSDEDFQFLIPIAQQIAILDLGGTQLSDSIFKKLERLPNLTILKLDNTAVTGKGIDLLATSEHLKTINLTGSKFEEPYLKALLNFKKLQKVFLYNTKAAKVGEHSLNEGRIIIDYGHYDLPAIQSDSVIY
ncbi:MAG: hypothetical protein QM485_10520 [Flavobacteriaceae bacterium]